MLKNIDWQCLFWALLWSVAAIASFVGLIAVMALGPNWVSPAVVVVTFLMGMTWGLYILCREKKARQPERRD